MGKPAKKRGAKKSRSEDMTGAKEAKVEMRKASDQAEMEMPPPDDILFHMRNIKGWKEKATTINASVRNARKSASKVNKLLPALIDELLALERLDDQSEFKRRMDMLSVGLKAVGSPYQINVFDMLAGDVQDQARKRGYDDAKANRVANSPYPENSDLSNSYLAGWQRGTAENLGLSEEDMDKLDSDRPAGEGHNEAPDDDEGEFAGTDEQERREPALVN